MNKLTYYFILALFIFPFTASAQYAFNRAGTVDRVDFKTKEIVIDDMFYKLGQTVTVYNHKNGIVDKKYVKPGVKLGIKLNNSTTTHSLYELWVLPSSFDMNKTPGLMLMPVPK